MLFLVASPAHSITDQFQHVIFNLYLEPYSRTFGNHDFAPLAEAGSCHSNAALIQHNHSNLSRSGGSLQTRGSLT